MKREGFRYTFSFKELMYFVFGKEECPKCKGKLIRSKSFTIKDGGEFFRAETDSVFCPGVKVENYFFVYSCSKCGSEFLLSELANIKINNK